MKKQKSIGHQRLAKLASFLYRVPAERFKMRSWKDDSNVVLSLSPSCGTQACAAGWATVLFEDEGFHFESGSTVPSYAYNQNWDAVEYFFDLHHAQALELFGSCNNIGRGPRQVAVRIKHFLKTGKI